MPSLARQSRLTPSSHGRRHFGTTTAGTQAPAVSLAPAPPRSGGTPSLPACAGPSARVGLRYRAELPGTLACSEPPPTPPPSGGQHQASLHCRSRQLAEPPVRCAPLHATFVMLAAPAPACACPFAPYPSPRLRPGRFPPDPPRGWIACRLVASRGPSQARLALAAPRLPSPVFCLAHIAGDWL